MPGRSERWDVLQEREARSNTANDVEGFGPAIAVVVARESFSGNAERLARKAATHQVDLSSKLVRWKRPHIVPDWSVWQHAVADSLFEHALAIGLTLDVTGDFVTKHDRGEASAPSPGEKFDGT